MISTKVNRSPGSGSDSNFGRYDILLMLNVQQQKLLNYLSNNDMTRAVLSVHYDGWIVCGIQVDGFWLKMMKII